MQTLSLAASGWESFLSHEGTHCAPACLTCRYWLEVWQDEAERKLRLSENLARLRTFRKSFQDFAEVQASLAQTLPVLLPKVYTDWQIFAEKEIKSLLKKYENVSSSLKNPLT